MNESLQKIEPPEDVQQPGNLVQYAPPPSPSLFGTADPVEVIARASRVAAALKDVIKAQGLISKISGKEYPRCEAWTLLGTMLGVFPVCVWTRPVQGGWEARVEAKTRDGSVVGSAEAQCVRTERNWRDREDFALRSMAQTRATAKALRMPLGFVMTLGGFQPTPAEEMDFAREPELPSKPIKPAKPTHATAKTRAWFLSEMRKSFPEQTILQWAVGREPCYLLPDEELEAWPLKTVPTSKARLAAMVDECAEFMGVHAKSAANGQQSANAGLPGGGQAGQSSDDPVETVVGKLEAVSEKAGQSAKGPWTRWGIRIGPDLWLNTFNSALSACAKENEGHTVKCHFKRGQKGNDLISIERAKKD